MAPCRAKVLGIRFTADEWATIARAAGDHAVAGWARTTLLSATETPPPERILLAEILALRTLVLHLQLALLHGETLTPESIRRLMARVDEDKLQHARERLALTGTRRIR